MTNEVLKALEERRSVRGYTAEMPSQELIDAVIKAGTYAPTGRGAQSPIIVEVTDKATRDLLSSSTPKSWAARPTHSMEPRRFGRPGRPYLPHIYLRRFTRHGQPDECRLLRRIG